MADTVTKEVISDTGIRYEILLTNKSDGTGESSVTKVDLSDLTVIGTNNSPTSLAVEYIDYTVNGFDSVTLAWDRSPSARTLAVLPAGNNKLTFSKYLVDPDHGQQGSTGDILLTTDGSVSANDSYIIQIRFKLVP